MNPLVTAGLLLVFVACKVSTQPVQNQTYQEEHRPQFHYSPQKNWMNDPNGLVYLDGAYHLFYQHDQYEKVFRFVLSKRLIICSLLPNLSKLVFLIDLGRVIVLQLLTT